VTLASLSGLRAGYRAGETALVLQESKALGDAPPAEGDG
jgi:hypothetical protein